MSSQSRDKNSAVAAKGDRGGAEISRSPMPSPDMLRSYKEHAPEVVDDIRSLVKDITLHHLDMERREIGLHEGELDLRKMQAQNEFELQRLQIMEEQKSYRWGLIVGWLGLAALTGVAVVATLMKMQWLAGSSLVGIAAAYFATKHFKAQEAKSAKR